jgi:hypothetical protein
VFWFENCGLRKSGLASVQTTSVSADAPAAVAIVSRPAARAETMWLRVIRESPIAVKDRS